MAPSNPFHDGKNWFYNRNSGEIKHASNYAEWLYMSSLGWMVRFKTKADAEKWAKANPPTNKNPFNPSNPTHPLNPGGGIVPEVPGSGVLTDVSGFLSALTQRNTWLRVGEGILGLLLIGIGVAALTKNTPIGSALRTGVKATPAGRITKALK